MVGRGGLGSQTGRGKNILSGPFDHGSVASEASGACNGLGPGARLGAPVGVQGTKPPWKFGVYAILGVGERRFSDDFLKQKS